MKVGTRLLLILLPIVAAIMTVYAFWALREREERILAEARQSTQAYASALGLALEQAFEDLEVQAVQIIVSRASLEPRIYRAQVYGASGTVLARSDSLNRSPSPWGDRLESVLTNGESDSFYAEVDGQPVFTVLRPLRDENGGVRAGLEVVQPLDVVAAEGAAVRRRFIFNAATLLLALTAASLLAVHRSVTIPLRHLVEAVRVLGKGELTHRVPEESSPAEVGDLAREFNKMAESLESARQKLIRESEERLVLDRQLRQTEQISAVGRLAVGLAHEIAAPLNVISGRAELVSRRADAGPELQRNLRIITDQITRISFIVRRLLDHARRPAAQRAPMDLLLAVDTIVEFMETELRRAAIEVAYHVRTPCWVDADRDQIHQALIAVMLNAVQAMVEVEHTRRLTIRTLVQPSVEIGGPTTVRVDILDTGPGIREDMIESICEPFVTTKENGTGLGLAVAKSIVEEHGGTIVASNRSDGAGAQISITLTAINEPALTYA